MKFTKTKPLRFGTSGLRDLVEHMTDMECYINTKGFLSYLISRDEFREADPVALGGDRRESTPRIKRAAAQAIADKRGKIDDQGLTPTPALTCYALKRRMAGVMVTGSHIPADRNGIKFTKKEGEVLKADEKGILECVSREREKVYASRARESMFTEDGMFKESVARPPGLVTTEKEYSGVSTKEYTERYTRVFGGKSCLAGASLFLYQHSAVGRDLVKDVFEALGAEVIAPDLEVNLDYVDERGVEKRESVALRSSVFEAVDTESVSNRTLAIFKKVMSENDLDVGVTTDGDSDRPLLVYRVYREGRPTSEITHITGDVLGLMAVLALEKMGVEINAVAVPVSANDAVSIALEKKGVEITLTRIGSPYVVAAMIESLNRRRSLKDPDWNVFSWESNGGFLTGNDIEIFGNTLEALPTRDPMLPLIAVIRMTEDLGVPVSDLLRQLPERYTYADRKKGFPSEKSEAIIQYLSPAEHQGVKEVKFTQDAKAFVTFFRGEPREFESGSEFHEMRVRFRTLFSDKAGFSEISGINYIDGVRIFFSNGDISHFRPSGNAPEFRNYAIANRRRRSKEIVETGLNRIIPEILDTLGF